MAYIEKHKLMQRIETEALRWGEEYDLSQIMGDIEDFPEADVVEVKQGVWKLDKYVMTEGQMKMPIEYACSLCGGKMVFSTYPYCPYCGAKMRGDAE